MVRKGQHRTGFVRAHVLPLVFGVSMMVFGCASFQQAASKAADGYENKVSPATTQIAATVAQTAGVVAAAAPATPVGNAALATMGVSGAVLAVDKVILALITAMRAAGVLNAKGGGSNSPPGGGDNGPTVAAGNGGASPPKV